MIYVLKPDASYRPIAAAFADKDSADAMCERLSGYTVEAVPVLRSDIVFKAMVNKEEKNND